MTTNNEETFIITVVKTNDKDVSGVASESLIKSLLQKGSFFDVVNITEMAKKKR